MGLGDHSPSDIEALFKAEVAKCGVADYDETLLEYVASMAHELFSDEGNAGDDNLGNLGSLGTLGKSKARTAP